MLRLDIIRIAKQKNYRYCDIFSYDSLLIRK